MSHYMIFPYLIYSFWEHPIVWKTSTMDIDVQYPGISYRLVHLWKVVSEFLISSAEVSIATFFLWRETRLGGRSNTASQGKPVDRGIKRVNSDVVLIWEVEEGEWSMMDIISGWSVLIWSVLFWWNAFARFIVWGRSNVVAYCRF